MFYLCQHLLLWIQCYIVLRVISVENTVVFLFFMKSFIRKLNYFFFQVSVNHARAILLGSTNAESFRRSVRVCAESASSYIYFLRVLKRLLLKIEQN